MSDFSRGLWQSLPVKPYRYELPFPRTTEENIVAAMRYIAARYGGLVSKPSLEDLDRCIHGRHAIDPCIMCPEGQSTGNKFLKPRQRIGTTLYGEPILAPDPEARYWDDEGWRYVSDQ